MKEEKDIKLNKEYLKLSINYFTLTNKILLEFSKQCSQLLDKTTNEQLRDCIMDNCNNVFDLMMSLENIVELSKEAYKSFSEEEMI